MDRRILLEKKQQFGVTPKHRCEISFAILGEIGEGCSSLIGEKLLYYRVYSQHKDLGELSARKQDKIRQTLLG